MSSSPGSRQKRPRVRPSESDDESSTESVRDEEFWMEDGSVVLEAGNRLFKVHKTVLSRSSTFFRDLWSLPQPEGEKMADGLFVVELQDDPEAWKDLLQALYAGSGAQVSWQVSVSNFPNLATRLRLASKYMFDDIRERIANTLYDAWGAKFSGTHTARVCTASRFIHPALIVRLARDCDLPKLLQPAYYDLSAFPSSKVTSPAVVNAQYWLHPALTDVDLRCVMMGRESLVQQVQKFDQIVTQQGGSLHDECRRKCRTFWRAKGGLSDTLATSHDPLEVLEGHMASVLYPQHGVCSNCAKALGSYISFFRDDLWASLPKAFCLE